MDLESIAIHSHVNVGTQNRRWLDTDVHHREFIIPQGFEWDGASVPRFAWCVVPKWGESTLSFLTHDFLYSSRGPPDITRKRADTILYEDLINDGMNKLRAKMIYATVRLFGSTHFRVE